MIVFDGIRKSQSVKAYLRDTSLATAKALSAFSGYTSTNVTACLIQAETNDLRVTFDGATTPTSTLGTLVKAGGEGLFLVCDPANVKIIQTAVSAQATVTLFQV